MFEYFSKKKTPHHLPKTDTSVLHLGKDTKGRPICLSQEMLCEHMLVTGSTGSGKTEFLISMMTQSIAQNSGGVFIDGKGDITLYAKMATIAEHFGRGDDLYVLNFMTGRPRADQDSMRSHRFNPFATGSGEDLAQLIVSLMEEVGGDGAMWKGRATAMLTGVMRALAWMRDQKLISLHAGDVRDYLSLRRIIDLCNSSTCPQMPEEIRRSIMSYLRSLPGFQEDKGYRQSQTTLDQHGYLEMQFTRIMSSLVDVYGHIFCQGTSDIDIEDIVRNKRILLILLPTMEKSSEELGSLGKVVVATLKNIASSIYRSEALSLNSLRKTSHETQSAMPFMCIMDECSFYMVDGMEVLAAQARSADISLVFSSQDFEAIRSRNTYVARSILTNTRTKVIMRANGMDAEIFHALDDTSPGRDDVQAFLDKRASKGRLFTSPGTLLSGLDCGEFVLMNSGMSLAGRSLYVNVRHNAEMSLDLKRFSSIEETADRILATRGLSRVNAMEDIPVTEGVLEYCRVASSPDALDGTDLAMEALQSLFNGKTARDLESDEIIEIGA